MRYESAEVADVARYVGDPAWVMEQKVDGIRCLVSTDADGRATLMSHTGERLQSGLAHHGAIASAMSCLKSCTVDGELLADGRLWIFDVLMVLGTDTRLLPQATRRALLDTMAPALEDTVVSILPQAVTATDKAALWESVIAAGAEGVVVKRTSATYSVGSRRSTDVLKIKITRTVDVVVIGRNSDGHRNATLGLHDGDTVVPVGRCSMVGKADAQVGDVIEVTFLNLTDTAKPVLYQPRMMRLRPDRTARSCSIDQLHGCTVSKAVVA